MKIHLSLLLTCALWAVSFIATKTALKTAPPVTVVALRLAVAALCFLPFLAARRGSVLTGGVPRLLQIALLSLFGTSLHFTLQTVGIDHTTASNASLWAMTCPISILLISALFLKEKISFIKMAGVLLAMAGVLAVLGPGFFRGLNLAGHLLGDGLVFMSIFFWAVFTVYGKRLNREMGALELLGAATVIGALCMAPAGFIEARDARFSFGLMTAEAWAAVIFLGAGCGFLANLLYFLALEKTESQKVGVYLYTIPPMTYVAAALLLGESIGAHLIAGSLLVTAGVFLTEKG